MQVRSTRPLLIAGVLALAIAVVAALVILRADPAGARPFATLDVVTGEAEIQRAGQDGFRPARDGLGLQPGDSIRTPPDGRVTIEYFDGSETRLDYGTTFTLTELVDDPQGPSVVEALHRSGSTFNRVVELTGSQSRFDVETPTAVASVRGTAFFTQVLEDRTFRVGVIEGEVLVGGEEGAEARVIAGRGVDVTSSGDVGGTFVLTADMLGSDWLFYNLCVLDQLPGACTTEKPQQERRTEERKDPKPPPEPTAPPSPPPAEQTAAAPQTETNQEPVREDAPNPPPPPPPPAPATEEPPPPPPPPSESPPPPPSPEPPPHPGDPPCDNPGNGDPCGGPGKAGSPPGKNKP
jgi:hypothetical protein